MPFDQYHSWRRRRRRKFLHVAMGLEFLTRHTQDRRTVLQEVLFSDGDIVEAAEDAEQEIE